MAHKVPHTLYIKASGPLVMMEPYNRGTRCNIHGDSGTMVRVDCTTTRPEAPSENTNYISDNERHALVTINCKSAAKISSCCQNSGFQRKKDIGSQQSGSSCFFCWIFPMQHAKLCLLLPMFLTAAGRDSARIGVDCQVDCLPNKNGWSIQLC